MIRSDRDESFTWRIDLVSFRQSNMIKFNISNEAKLLNQFENPIYIK